jgi:two-component system NtrC family response regulator
MILIIDDDKAVRSSLALILKQAGYPTMTAEDPEEALAVAAEHPPELFVLDMNFSVKTTGEEGLVLLKELKRRLPDRPVVLITAWGSIPLAVEGMKAGAADFITKPWNNDHFLQTVNTALSLSRSAREDGSTVKSRAQLDSLYDFEKIVGADKSLLTILQTLGRVSATDAPVLIVGESGTGKELIAEAIHVNSTRRHGPFVRVNLGGIPAGLFESEMFGHRKGAFTDAVRDRIGRFALAEGGTIFLDEIGELDSNSQVKLLRVLQDRSFEVLGTSDTTTIDFRLVCATNRDLPTLVGERRFREDLYYRINLITLNLPPLRKRPDDIPLLVQHFVDNLKVIYGRPVLTVSSQALAWLRTIPWPGNIRELKNLVERTVLVGSSDELEIDDFKAQFHPTPARASAEGLPAVGIFTLDEMEKSMILKALEFHASNLSKVARSLGLSRAALYRRLEKYGISV